MAERLKAHAWKACIGETLSWVRIPFSPPLIILIFQREFNTYQTFLKKINQQFFLKNDIYMSFQKLKNDK